MAIKAAFLNCGQNCAGGERFFVHTKVYNAFVEQVTAVVSRMRQGHALSNNIVDCGAMCMPGLAEKVQVCSAIRRPVQFYRINVVLYICFRPELDLGCAEKSWPLRRKLSCLHGRFLVC